MPTDIWKAELSFDGFTYTPTPDPAFGRFAQWWVGLEAICLPVADPFPPHNATPDDGDFAIYTGYATGGAFRFSGDGAFQYVTMRLGQPDDRPQQWGQPFIISEISGADPALLTAGGTLSITKDYDANLMTFDGPVGTQTCSLSDIDALPGGPYGYNNTTPLRARGYGERLIFPVPTGFDPAYDIDQQVRYYNLIGRQNGVVYDTVALSAADPGTWWPVYSDAFVPGFGTVSPGLSPWWTFPQLVNRQEWRVQIDDAAYPDWNNFIVIKRRGPPMSEATDMATAHDSGVLWRAGMSADMVVLERSFDNGHSWDMFMVHADALATNSSPTVNWVNQRLAVTWYDGTNILEAHSVNGGETWGMPITLPFTGTNPRRLTEMMSGAGFYFYFDAGPNLLLSVSYDNGGSYVGPYTVAAGLTAQQVDAEFAPDGSLVVSYFVAGVWTQSRSRDLGVTWA
jgi:hypothetical protein